MKDPAMEGAHCLADIPLEERPVFSDSELVALKGVAMDSMPFQHPPTGETTGLR